MNRLAYSLMGSLIAYVVVRYLAHVLNLEPVIQRWADRTRLFIIGGART